MALLVVFQKWHFYIVLLDFLSSSTYTHSLAKCGAVLKIVWILKLQSGFIEKNIEQARGKWLEMKERHVRNLKWSWKVYIDLKTGEEIIFQMCRVIVRHFQTFIVPILSAGMMMVDMNWYLELRPIPRSVWGNWLLCTSWNSSKAFASII